jgi:hypothetical protein
MRGYHTKVLHAMIGILLWAGCAAAARADVFTCTDPQFTLNEPDGYVQVPATGDVLYSCATSDPNFSMPDAIIEIVRLPGTIRRGPIDLDDPTLKTYIPDATATTKNGNRSMSPAYMDTPAAGNTSSRPGARSSRFKATRSSSWFWFRPAGKAPAIPSCRLSWRGSMGRPIGTAVRARFPDVAPSRYFSSPSSAERSGWLLNTFETAKMQAIPRF